MLAYKTKNNSAETFNFGGAPTSIQVACVLLGIAAKTPTKNNKTREFYAETLQKLVFVVHGYHLALRDKAMISDDVLIGVRGPFFANFYEEIGAMGTKIAVTEQHHKYAQEFEKVFEDEYLFIEYVFNLFVIELEIKCENLDYLALGSLGDWVKIFGLSLKKQSNVLPSEVIKKRFFDDISTTENTSYDLEFFTKMTNIREA